MLAPWKKSYDQPRQHIKKQRHYFANKGPPSQGYGFSSSHVLMWELDYKKSWELKNWCFWTAVLEKTLESPLRISNQSILKEVSLDYSLEGLMLKLKLQYFGHLIWSTDSFEKTLMLGKIEGRRRRGRQRLRGLVVSPTQWTWVWVNSRSWWWTGRPGVLQSMGVTKSQTCPPVSFVHGILQARTLEWVAISFSRGSSRPRDWTQVSRIGGRRFNLWATREQPCN